MCNGKYSKLMNMMSSLISRLPQFCAIFFSEVDSDGPYWSEERYDLFPVRHELRRRVEMYNNALEEILQMSGPYLPDEIADGINYWELFSNFTWQEDYVESIYTQNYAARMIQRVWKSFLLSQRLAQRRVFRQSSTLADDVTEIIIRYI